MKKFEKMLAVKHMHHHNRLKEKALCHVDSSLPWSHSQQKLSCEGRSRPLTRACPSRMPTVRDSSKSDCSSRSFSHPELKRHNCLTTEKEVPFSARSSSLPPRPPSRQKGSVEHTGRTPERKKKQRKKKLHRPSVENASPPPPSILEEETTEETENMENKKKKRKRKLHKPSVEITSPPPSLEEETTEETENMENVIEIKFSEEIESEEESTRPKTPHNQRRPTGYPFNCVEEHRKLNLDENVGSSSTDRLGDPLYLQFALHITEDIIRNDHYTSSEMKKIITSHVNANRGILDEEQMLEQVYALCNDLNLSPIQTENDETETEGEDWNKLPVVKKCTCPFVSKYQDEILKETESNEDYSNMESTPVAAEQTTDAKIKIDSAESPAVVECQTKQKSSELSFVTNKIVDPVLPKVERLFEIDLSPSGKNGTASDCSSHFDQHVAEKLEGIRNVFTQPTDAECSNLALDSRLKTSETDSNDADKDMINNIENVQLSSEKVENINQEVKSIQDENPQNADEENVEKVIKKPALDSDKSSEDKIQTATPTKSVSFVKKISVASESSTQQCPCEEILNKLLNKTNFCVNSCCQKLNLIEKFLLENEILITVGDSQIESIKDLNVEDTSNTDELNVIIENDDGKVSEDFNVEPEKQLDYDITVVDDVPVSDAQNLCTEKKRPCLNQCETNNNLQSDGSPDETVKINQEEKCCCQNCEICICELKIGNIGDSLYSFVRMNDNDVSTQMTTKIEKQNVTTMTDPSISPPDFRYEKDMFKDEGVNTCDYMFLDETDVMTLKKIGSITSKDTIINLPIKLHDVSMFYPSIGVQTDEEELSSMSAVQCNEVPQTYSKSLLKSSLDCTIESQQLAQRFINNTRENLSDINFLYTTGLEVKKETSEQMSVRNRSADSNKQTDGKKRSADSNEQTDGKKRSADSNEQTDGKKRSVDLNEQTDGKKRSADSNEQTDGKKRSADLNEQTDGKKRSADLNEQTDGKKRSADLNEQTDAKRRSSDFNKITNAKKRSADSNEQTDGKKRSADLNEQTDGKKRSADLNEQTDGKKRSADWNEPTDAKKRIADLNEQASAIKRSTDLNFELSGFAMHKLSSLCTNTRMSSNDTYSQNVSKDDSSKSDGILNTSKINDSFEKINEGVTTHHQDSDDKSSVDSSTSFIKHLDNSPKVYVSASMENSLNLIKTEMEHFRRGEEVTAENKKNVGYFDNLDNSEGSESVDAVSRVDSFNISAVSEVLKSKEILKSDLLNAEENLKNELQAVSDNAIPNTDSGNSKASERRRSIRFESND